jgi:hypothetical protein
MRERQRDSPYPQMLDAIERVAVSVELSSYIFRPDELGERFIEAEFDRTDAVQAPMSWPVIFPIAIFKRSIGSSEEMSPIDVSAVFRSPPISRRASRFTRLVPKATQPGPECWR